MKTQAQIHFTGARPQCFEFRATFHQLIVKLRHIGMRQIGREIAGKAIHRNADFAQIIEHFVRIFDAFTQVRIGRVTAGIVAFEALFA